MNKNNIIRSIATLALLLLFSLSNTPKQWLHDIFANHKDCTTTISKNNLLISQQGFNCDCDSLVVEVPFTSADKIFIGLPVLAIHSAFASLMDDNFSSVYHFYFELRGPPSVA